MESYLTTPAKKHLAWPDLVRCVGVIAVIAIHTSAWFPSHGVYATVGSLARVSVPLFVLLAGLVIAYRYSAGVGPPGRFLHKRAMRTLLPWLFWAPLYFVASFTFLGEISPGLAAAAGWWSQGAGHLYFLLIIPQLYVAYLLWPRGERWAAWLAVAAICFQLGISAFRLYGTLPVPWAETLLLDNAFELFFFWIGYFALGVLVGRRIARGRWGSRVSWKLRLLSLFAFGGALALYGLLPMTSALHGQFAGGTGAFLTPTLFPAVCATTWLCFCWVDILLARRVVARAVAGISKHSLGIYIVHPLVLFGIGRTLPSIYGLGGTPTVAGLAGMVLLTLVISWTGVVGMTRIRLGILVGEAAKPAVVPAVQ